MTEKLLTGVDQIYVFHEAVNVYKNLKIHLSLAFKKWKESNPTKQTKKFLILADLSLKHPNLSPPEIYTSSYPNLNERVDFSSKEVSISYTPVILEICQ